MKIAYLAPVFPRYTNTFVLNEVVAHDVAGLEVLPLSCDRPSDAEALSAVARRWRQSTLSPSGFLARVGALVRECVAHPLAAIRNLLWLLGLLTIDPKEFLLGLRELSTAACLAPACRALGVQHLHVHFASRSLTAGILLARWAHLPLSCTVHAYDLWSRSGRNLRYRLKRCAFIAAISRYNVDYLRQQCGDEIARLCHVVHCGIDLSQFDASNRQPAPGRILQVSAFTEKKGHRFLVDACAILRQRNVPFECILIGEGWDRVKIEAHVAGQGLGDRVRILGALPNDELRPYLDSAAVFVLPAIVPADGNQDGIPVALMEAMACGIPVVSTRVSGIPELLRDGQAGCLVPPEDAAALADALQRLLADPAEAGRLASAGRAAVEQEFDIARTSEQLRGLFAEAIQIARS